MSPAAADRPKCPRFYVLRVLHNGDPPLVAVVHGPYCDLFAAWQQASQLRAQRPDTLFIAGEMLSATLPTG